MDDRDGIRQEARTLADMFDRGNMSEQARNRLMDDFRNMSPAQSHVLANELVRMDQKQYGDNVTLTQTRDGKEALVIDSYNGRREMVTIPSMPNLVLLDNGRPMRDAHPVMQPRYGDAPQQQGYYEQGQPQRRGDQTSRVVTDGVIGAVTGAAVDNRRGAIAGGAGAVVGDVIHPNSGSAVTDTVVKGVAGAVVGGAIDGNKGAKAGALGSIIPGLLRNMTGDH